MHEDGFLDVGDGHRVWWRSAGPVDAPAFLLVHGGPGAGSDPRLLDLFDLNTTRAVQIDQRGAGRSTPKGEVAHNTTDSLLADMEAVRRHLDIPRWTVLGGSWGTTLALLYAGDHPDRCEGLILRGVTEWTRDKFDWALHGRRFLAPAAHDYLLDILDKAEHTDVLAAYHRRIMAGEREAAKRWNLYERQFSHPVPLVPVGDEAGMPADFADRARIHVHYWINGAFVDEDRMRRATDAIRHLPVYIVQGGLDLMCPPLFATNLAKRLPRATLRIVPGAGHVGSIPAIRDALADAVSQFRSRLGPYPLPRKFP